MKIDDIEKRFAALATPLPPKGFSAHIMNVIERRELRILWVKVVGLGAVFAGSLAAIGLGATFFASQVAQSGFSDLAGLIFSDYSMAVANLPDFLLSLLSLFPAFSAAIVLSGILFAIWSMAELVGKAGAMRSRKFAFLSQ